MYGVGWLEDTSRMIREDEINEFKMLKLLIPLARSAMDKNSAQGLDRYSKSIDRMFESALPWRPAQSRNSSVVRSGKLKSGEVAVILDAGDDPNNPLFKEIPVIKE